MNKKSIIIAIGIAVIAVTVGTWTGIYLHARRTLSVACYNLPKNISDELKKQIKVIKPEHTEFHVLDSSLSLTVKTAKKYDLIFTWGNKETTRIAAAAITPSDSIYGQLPLSVRKAGIYKGKKYAVPLLIDHFETAFYTTMLKKTGTKIPETVESLESYARLCKQYCDAPLICAGAKDTDLIGFVSVLTEALCGKKGYTLLINTLDEKSFDKVLSVQLAKNKNGPITLEAVLDRIKSWQNDGILLKHWYEATDRDVLTYMENHRTAVIFMTLSEHREKPIKLIKYYQATRFPSDLSAEQEALVAPVVEAIMIHNTAGEEYVLSKLVSDSYQKALSSASRLGPAASHAEAHDRQADDVRFWAASCAGGPVPELAAAAFGTSRQTKEFAAAIRDYLKK